MITEVKTYTTEFNESPSDNDIKECIELAKKYNCVINLVWTLKWSGHFSHYIHPNSTFEDIKNTMPRCYGL